MTLEERIAELEARNASLEAEIEELRADRETLRAELERFRDFASCASEWRWEMGPDLRMTSIAEQCEHATGLQIRRLIGKRREEIGDFQPGDPTLRRHLADLEKRRPFRDFEYSAVIEDGATRHFSVSGNPVFGLAGEFLGYRGIARDITATKQAEREALEAKELFKAVMDAAPVSIVIKDTEGRYLQANRLWETSLGVCGESVIGREVREILPEVYASAIRDNDRRALDEGRIVESEEQLPHRDGTVHDYLAVRFPLSDSRGAVRGLGLIGMDITRRKEFEIALRNSESQLRTITDNLPVFIAQFDLEARYRFVNKIAEAWYGLPVSKIIGRSVSEVFGEYVYESVRPQIEAVRSGRSSRFEGGIRYPDGKLRQVAIDFVPERTAAGDVQGWLTVVQDISERKRLEADLLRKERLAAMGQLTATVAHELRNPLGAVAMSLGVVRARCESSGLDLGRALVRAARGIERCDRIVTELLDFARARGLQLAPTRLDLWLAGILEEYEFPSGVALSRNLAGAGVTADIDPEWLRRAIINLLENSCQALTDQDGGVRAGAAPALTVTGGVANGRFEILVADNGPGIAKDILPKVAEPLVSTKSFGTGLGLPTVKRIIEDHGGGMEIYSEPGAGTRVMLWLPLDGWGADAKQS